jgi:hypothetical protein
LEWEHVSSPGFDAKLNPNKNVLVAVLGDHGAVFIDIFGTVGVGRIAEQIEGRPGTNNVTIQNQFLLGIQSGLLTLPQDKQLRDEDSNTCSNQVESGAMLWYTEWEHQANFLATCKATDCWREERGHQHSSGATWKSCSLHPRYDGEADADGRQEVFTTSGMIIIMASVGEKQLDFPPALSEVAQSIGTTDGRCWCGTWLDN